MSVIALYLLCGLAVAAIGAELYEHGGAFSMHVLFWPASLAAMLIDGFDRMMRK